MNNETIFTEGIYLNKVADTAPSFIITNQSLHVDKLIAWLQANRKLANEKGYINIVGMEGKEGKRYFKVDTYKPKTPVLDTVDYGDERVKIGIPEGKGIDVSEFGDGSVNVDDIPF
jgi:hypothetical protein